MRELIGASFDPGEITGFDFRGSDGHIWHGQEELEQAMRLVIPYMKQNPCGFVTVEGVFVGPDARAALAVAESAGKILGYLACAGVLPPASCVWRPAPATWRKDVEISYYTEVDGKKVRPDRKEYERRARLYASSVVGGNFDNRTHEAEAICMGDAGWERWAARTAA